MRDFKKDFPIFTHNKKLVYLDSAATSQKPQVVIDAVTAFYETYNSNIHRGIYPIAERATNAVEVVREKVARFIHAKNPSEIVFTHGTTTGINMLAFGLVGQIKRNDVILLSEAEHHSNIVPWQQVAKETKARLLYMAVDNEGFLDGTIIDTKGKKIYSSIGKIPNLRVVSFSHVTNVLGIINPVRKLIKQIKKITPTPLTIIDAAQSIAHMLIDIQDMDCDFIVFSGHKIFAPTGIGILYGKKEKLQKIAPLIVGSQMIREVRRDTATWADVPYMFEPGTLPLEGIIGLGSAIDYIQEAGFDLIQKHEKQLLSYCLGKLLKIKEIRVLGTSDTNMRSGIVSFVFDSVHPHDVAQILGEKNICIRAGHHCAMPLHTRFDIQATCRISFSLYNSYDDIDKLILGLQTVKKILR